MGHDSRIPKVIALAVNESPAVPYIRGNGRLMRGISLQNGKRLPFTEAGQDRHIHPAQIIPDINPSGEDHILNPQRLHLLQTFPCIPFVLIHGPHDPQLQSRFPLLGKAECLDHCFHILDRRHTKHGADIDLSLVLFRPAGKIFQPFYRNPVGRDHRFFHRAAKIYLELPGIFIQAGHQVSLLICQLRHLLKLVDPYILVYPLHPFRPQQFLLPLSGIDPMLRDQQPAVIKHLRHTAQYTGISGGHAMVQIRLRKLHLQGKQQRQIHGAYRPQKI